ncbi:MAG TPA: 30S ribosome-binding factor RbfA [Stellaceae bacterium]|nr:30S ribosome-binding factor RbfA [Stellaceae bacterium]
MAGTRRERQPPLREARPGRGAEHRRLRLGEVLRHALAQLLRPGECRDPALFDANITVSEVTLSPDLRNAKAYVLPLAGTRADEIMAGLARSTPYLKGRLARAVSLRRVPELTFALDRSFEHAERIAALLARPDVERDLDRAAEAEENDDAG